MDTDLLHPTLARYYQIKTASSFDVLSDLSSEPNVEDEWNSFRDAVYTAADITWLEHVPNEEIFQRTG